jgi:hypothetical protein
VFDPEDYQNHIPKSGGEKARIRGAIHPINVVEPILWLGRNMARTAEGASVPPAVTVQDAGARAPDLLAGQTEPVRFNAAAIRQLAGNLPKEIFLLRA